MKTKKQISKKVLSVFLAVLMVMTAWVFVAPTEAEAALAYGMSTVSDSFSKSTMNITNWGTISITYPSKMYIDKTESLNDAQYYLTITASNTTASLYLYPVCWGGQEFGASYNTAVGLKGQTSFVDAFNGYGISKWGPNSTSSGTEYGSGWFDNVTYDGQGCTIFRCDNPSSNLSGGSDKYYFHGTPSSTGTFSFKWSNYNTNTANPIVGSSGGLNNNKIWLSGVNTSGTRIDMTIVVYDKSTLNSTINNAKTNYPNNNNGKYTATSWNNFQTALTNAQNILTKREVTQTEINTAVSNVTSSINNLVLEKYTLTFKSINGTTKTYTYDYGTSINCYSLAPANTISQIAGNDSQHQTYVWDSTNMGITTLVDDVTINEVTSNKVGHTFPADATVAGDNHTWTCSVCGYVKVQAHVKDDGTITKAETCTEDGVKTYNCSICGKQAIATETINKINGHDFTTAAVIKEDGKDGTHWKKCSRCDVYGWGTTVGACEDHDWDRDNDGKVTAADAVETKASTCKDAGYEKYACEVCSATYTNNLELAAHITTKTDAVVVTNICGGDGNEAFWSCSVCDRVWKDEALTDEVTDLTDADGDNIPDVLETKGPEHDFTGAYVSVTPGADGTHKRQCVRFTQCQTYSAEESHNYGEPAVTDATCTATGKEVYTCEDCKQTYEVTLNKVAHKMTKIDAVAAECNKPGNNEYYYCSGCSKYYKDADGTTETTAKKEVIPGLTHIWTTHHDYDTVKTPATCMAAAVYYNHCDYCKAKLTDTHSYSTPDTVNGHKFDGEIKKNDDGTHSYKCTVAGCPEYGKATTCTYVVTADVDSTCKTAGYTTYECTTCGNGYSDKKALDYNNHTGEGTYIIGNQAPTCATLGSTGIEKCSGCNATLSTKLNDIPVDLSNHENMKDYEGKNATCQEAGWTAYRYCDKCGIYEIAKTEILAKAHKFTKYISNGDGTHTATCDTCDATVAEPATDTKDCSGGTANCEDKKVCTVCNTAYGEVDATNHKSIKTATKQDSTCQTEGYEAYTYCDACNTQIGEKKPIAKKAHVYGSWSKVAGEDKHTRSCTTCKADVAEVATEEADCNGGVAYCNAKAVCSDCKAEYGEKDATNHKSEAWTLKNAKPASCTEEGYTGDKHYNCCDALKEAGTKIEKEAHSFTIESSRKAATCIEKGSVTYECSTCPEGNRETKTDEIQIDAKNHASTETTVVGEVAATCEKDGFTGNKYYTCCYDATKTEAENKKALASAGTVIKANGQHTFTTVIPEYTVKEIKEETDENGKIKREFVLVDSEISYDAKVAARHTDGKWYHYQMCTTCYELKISACYTYSHTANCVETDICEECGGLCSLRAENEHGQITKFEKISATCTTAGRNAYYVCEVCDKEYFDAACTKEITEENKQELVIPATGNHTINRNQTPVTVLDENGNSTGEHVYECTYSYTNADGEVVKCGTKVTEACSGGEADCQNKAVCEYCDAEYGSTNANKHAEEAVITENVAPDKCKPGYTGKTIYPCCNVVAYEGTVLPAVEDHDWSETTEGQVDNCAQGYTIIKKCNYCGEEKSVEVAGGSHNLTRVVYETEKDCTKVRNIYYACSICSFTDKTVEIDGETYNYINMIEIPAAENCSWTSWKYEVRATCVQEGKKTRECTVCHKVETVILPLADHILNTEEGYAPSCQSEGKQNYVYCVIEGCPYVKGGAILDPNQAGAIIPAYEHNEDKNGDDYCDHCGQYTQINIDGTNCNCVCHKQNGLMKFIYSILRFFWKLFGISRTCCSAGVHY